MLLFRLFAQFCCFFVLLLTFVAFSSFCSLLNGKNAFSSEVLRDRFGIPSGFLRDSFGIASENPEADPEESRSNLEPNQETTCVLQKKLYR
jgi:hypothetical protein